MAVPRPMSTSTHGNSLIGPGPKPEGGSRRIIGVDVGLGRTICVGSISETLVGVAVGVSVGVGVSVAVDVGVRVRVAVSVGVKVAVAVAVSVGV